MSLTLGDDAFLNVHVYSLKLLNAKYRTLQMKKARE